MNKKLLIEGFGCFNSLPFSMKSSKSCQFDGTEWTQTNTQINMVSSFKIYLICPINSKHLDKK